MNDMFAEARGKIQAELAKGAIPSLALAVARDGEILWEEGFGWADRAKRAPATPHTAYCLASVSKPLTATGLMKLVETGKIDLDAPINRYLHPDSPLKVWVGDPEQATVRRVANHTSGLPLHANFYCPGDRVGRPPMEETIRRYGNLVTAPGERYRYSNIGYGILEHLIERVSGMSCDAFLRREIFLPLGMTRSAAALSPEMEPYAAVRYGEEGRPIVGEETDHGGASSFYSSARDLAVFGMFHLKQPLPGRTAPLSNETLDAMHTPTASMASPNPSDLNLRGGSKYGVGWVVDEDGTDQRISHGGGMGGCASKILLLPEHGVVVAVVSNLFNPFAYTIEDDILSPLLPGHAEKLAARRAERRDAQPESEPAFQPSAELMGDWRGSVRTHEGDEPVTLSFKPSGEVHAKIGIQPTALVNEPRLKNGWLTGTMAGNVFTADTNRKPRHPFHHIKLDLRYRGDRINGALIAVAGCELNHWVELKREAGEE